MARGRSFNSLNKNVPQAVTYAILFVIFLLAIVLVQRLRMSGEFLGGF